MGRRRRRERARRSPRRLPQAHQGGFPSGYRFRIRATLPYRSAFRVTPRVNQHASTAAAISIFVGSTRFRNPQAGTHPTWERPVRRVAEPRTEVGGTSMLRVPSSSPSPVNGLSRREFLGYCGTLAAMLGLGQAGIPTVAAAIEEVVKKPLLVWSDFQECLGCTVALLQSTAPTPAQLILQQTSLAYNEAAMAAAGKQANENFDGGDRGRRVLGHRGIGARRDAGGLLGQTASRRRTSSRRTTARPRASSPSARARALATCKRTRPTRPARWASASGCGAPAECRMRPS